MKAIERLFQYFEFKGIKPTRFEKDNGISNGYFSVQHKRNADIGSGVLETIINNCRDLNIEWLILGKGEMLIDITEGKNKNKHEITPQLNNNELLDRIERLSAEKALLQLRISELEKNKDKPSSYSIAAEPTVKLKHK